MMRIVGILLVLIICGTSGCATDSEGVYRTNYPGNIGCAKESTVLHERLVAAGFTRTKVVNEMYIYTDSDSGRIAVLVKDWRVVSRLPVDWCAMECPTSGPRFAGCPN